MERQAPGRSSRRRPPAAGKGFPVWAVAVAVVCVVLGLGVWLVYPSYHRASVVRRLLSADEAARQRACAEARHIGPGIVSDVVAAARNEAAPAASGDICRLLMDLVAAAPQALRPSLRLKVKRLAYDWAEAEEPDKRRAAAVILAACFKTPQGTVEPEVKEALLRLVRDPESAVRAAVVEGLSEEDRSREAVEISSLAAEDEVFDVRAKARLALSAVTCPEAASLLLLRAKETSDAGLKALYLRLLAPYVGRRVKLEEVVPFLEHPSPEVRRSAVLAVGYASTGEAEKYVVKALQDPSAEVRAEAANGIRSFRFKKLGAPAVTRALPAEPVKKVKLEMMKAIYMLQATYAAVPLARLAADEGEDEEVRLKALEAITKLNFRTPEESLPLAGELIKVMRVENPKVAERAKETAARLVYGQVPRTLEEWDRWYAERKKELQLLEAIRGLMREGRAAEDAARYDRAEDLYRRAQGLYTEVMKICYPRYRSRYERRQRHITLDIRRVQQKARLAEAPR